MRGPACVKSRCFASTCSVCNLSVRGRTIFPSLSLSLCVSYPGHNSLPYVAWVWGQKKPWLFCRQSFTPYLPHSQEVPISVCLAGMVVMRSTCSTGLQSILSVQLAVAASVWRREDGPNVLVYTFLSSTEILIRFIEWTTMAELVSFPDHIIHTSLGMRLWQHMAENWYMCAQNIIKELPNI